MNKQFNLKKKKAELSRYLSQEDIQTANGYMKRCSTSLAIRKMQVKTTVIYHLTPVRMAITNKTRTSVGERLWRSC